MPKSLNYPPPPTTATTTPVKKPTTSFLLFSRLKTTNSLALSSITTTTTTPLKPPLNTLPTNPETTTTDDNSCDEFRDKVLFLDSHGLDPLSNFPPSTITTSASLHDLKAVFDYLTSLGFTPPDLRRAISMCPQILTLNLRQIASIFTFLLLEARVPATSLRHVIRRKPRLLISDVKTRLRPTMYFLQSIGIHEVNKYTDLLSSCVEDKYLPKIHYFEKLGFTYRETVSMFRKFPALFCYSVRENYEPKFNYFVVEMGRDLNELKEFPQYFSFSLENRIKPRHQQCVENGVCLRLGVLLKMKDEEFRERVDVCCNSSLPKSTSPLWCAQHKLDF